MRPHILKFFRSLFGVAVLCFGLWSVLPAQPVITARFADPEYTCATGQYCVGVQFQAEEPDQEVIGVNVRFFYDVEQLTLQSFTGFQGGYGSPTPPMVNSSGPGVGYSWFGFGSPGTGVAAYVNGVVLLQNPTLPPILIPTTGWAELFRVCFTVGETNVDSASYCPPLVWDLEVDPANGGWLPGNDGLVITLVDPPAETMPATEHVDQYNWAYSGNQTPPYGAPVEETCIDLLCVPVITCPADLTIDCTASSLPSATGEASAVAVCGATNTVVHVDSVAVPPGSCDGTLLIRRRWIATNSCDVADTCDQWITVTDVFPPGLACPADVTVACVDDTSPAATGWAAATDNCDANPGVAHADLVLDPPGDPGYVIERTWTATDACGNSATCLQVITVTNPLVPEEIPFDTICSGGSVMFEVTDPGYPGMSFSWAFGSGSAPGSASGPGPHAVDYAYDGNNGTTGAWVVLTQAADGCETVTDTVSNVHVNVIPAADIVTPAGSPCIFEPTVFQPVTAEVPGYSYLWDFGMGALPATASTYGPHTVEYSTAGSKTVQLIIQTNESGASCGDTATTTFTVNTCVGNIAGLVTLTDGTPLAGVLHQLFADNDLDGQPDNATVIKTGISTAAGTFLMTSVTPGYYVIQQTQPGAYMSVLDEDTSEDYDSLANVNTNDNLIPVTVEPGELDAQNRFWESASPGIITGCVFDDNDNDGLPGAAEGIPDVTVQLFADEDQDGEPDSGTPLLSATTNALGLYTFENVETGDYVIVETQPAGFTNVLDVDISADGDAVPNTNMTDDKIPVTMQAAEYDAGNYFIERVPCPLLVTDAGDAGPGTFRDMIDCAQSGDTITFDPSLAGDTIVLHSIRIAIDKTVFIHSAIVPPLVIRSEIAGAFRILPDGAAEFRNLHIVSGLDGTPAAAFEVLGDLTLENVSIFPNPLLAEGAYLIFNGSSGMIVVRNNTSLYKE